MAQNTNTIPADLLASILADLPKVPAGSMISGAPYEPFGLGWYDGIDCTGAVGGDITDADVDTSDLDEDDIEDGREVRLRIRLLQDYLLDAIADKLGVRVTDPQTHGGRYVTVPQTNTERNAR